MELKHKKRIIGIVILIALGLILFPIFLGDRLPTEELQLSSQIPAPPAKPRNLVLPMQPVPLSAGDNASPPVISSIPTTAAAPAAGNIIFEQVSPSSSAVVTAQSQSESSLPVMPNEPSSNTAEPLLPVTQPSATPPVIMPSSASTSLTKSLSSVANVPELVSPQPIGQASSAAFTSTNLAVSRNTAPHPTAWAVQLGSFSAKINAENLMTKLQAQGFAAYIVTLKTAKGSLSKVMVGPELQRSAVDRLLLKLQQAVNIKGIVVKVEV